MSTTTEGWRSVKLAELLTDAQCVRVGVLLEARDARGLRTYLEGLEGQLVDKGVLPAYLFYILAKEYGL